MVSSLKNQESNKDNKQLRDSFIWKFLHKPKICVMPCCLFFLSTIVHKDTRFVCKSLVFYWKFILFDCFKNNAGAGASSWDKTTTKKKWYKKGDMQIEILCWTRLYSFYPFFSLFDFVFSWMDYILLNFF